MISLEKWNILTPLQILLKNVGDLDKPIVAIGFEKLPKVQKIAQSGHTEFPSDWECPPSNTCERETDTQGSFLFCPSPASFSSTLLFWNKKYDFSNKYMRRNVHLLYGTGIRTHSLQNMSLLP